MTIKLFKTFFLFVIVFPIAQVVKSQSDFSEGFADSENMPFTITNPFYMKPVFMNSTYYDGHGFEVLNNDTFLISNGKLMLVMHDSIRFHQYLIKLKTPIKWNDYKNLHLKYSHKKEIRSIDLKIDRYEYNLQLPDKKFSDVSINFPIDSAFKNTEYITEIYLTFNLDQSPLSIFRPYVTNFYIDSIWMDGLGIVDSLTGYETNFDSDTTVAYWTEVPDSSLYKLRNTIYYDYYLPKFEDGDMLLRCFQSYSYIIPAYINMSDSPIVNMKIKSNLSGKIRIGVGNLWYLYKDANIDNSLNSAFIDIVKDGKTHDYCFELPNVDKRFVKYIYIYTEFDKVSGSFPYSSSFIIEEMRIGSKANIIEGLPTPRVNAIEDQIIYLGDEQKSILIDGINNGTNSSDNLNLTIKTKSNNYIQINNANTIYSGGSTAEILISPIKEGIEIVRVTIERNDRVFSTFPPPQFVNIDFKVTVLNKYVSVTERSSKNIEVYPTIANSNIHVNVLNSNSAAKLIIFDVTGKPVLQETIFDEIEINIESLIKGMYIIQIENNTGLSTSKFIKQ